RLVGILPAATRVLFVGDTGQLPPIGAGLVFHALSDTAVPFFHLSQVQRQDEQSGIHRFAMSVRNALPEIPPDTKATLAESADCTIESNADIGRLIDLWNDAGGAKRCIVLSPIRKGELGVTNINLALQHASDASRPSLHYQDPLRGWIPWVTESGARLLLGDRVLVTANNYVQDADLRNGDLGVVSDAFQAPSNTDGAVGMLEVNGLDVRITPDLVEKLDLGYAVTIHKAQGSQWPTCFVMLPTEAKQMADRSLVYTAATRPRERLVLMGNADLIEAAVRRGASASMRETCLTARLLSLLDVESVGAA
ncbi:MAG: AAA family ATPase, partial [Spiribacter salinus]